MFAVSAEVDTNDDGTFKITATLTHQFSRSDNGKKLRCKIEPEKGRGRNKAKDTDLLVYCKYLFFRCVHWIFCMWIKNVIRQLVERQPAPGFQPDARFASGQVAGDNEIA